MRQAICFACLLLFLLSVHASPDISGGWNRKWAVQLTRDHVCAMTGSSVILPCFFTHPSHVKVTKVYWTKNKQSTGIWHHFSKERVQYFWKNDNNCTMKLSNLTLLDKGVYSPIIESHSRQKTSSDFKVTLSVKELSVGITEPVIEGKTMKLSCENICSSIGSPTVIWRKNGQDLPVEQTNNNELILHSVSLDDAGNYSCALKDHEGQLSKPAELNVLYAPKNTVVSLNQSGDLLEGSSVTLTCSCDANPPVENYTWYRRTGAERVHVGIGEIITFSLTSSNAGHYLCEAKNSVGALNSTGHEVVLAGFGRKTTTLWSLFGVVSFTALLIGLVFWRRRKAKRINIPRTTDTQLGNEYGDFTVTHLTTAQNVASGDADELQYSTLQFKTSRRQEVSLHSTVQRPSPHTQQEQQEEVIEYAAVRFFKHTAATQ